MPWLFTGKKPLCQTVSCSGSVGRGLCILGERLSPLMSCRRVIYFCAIGRGIEFPRVCEFFRRALRPSLRLFLLSLEAVVQCLNDLHMSEREILFITSPVEIDNSLRLVYKTLSLVSKLGRFKCFISAQSWILYLSFAVYASSLSLTLYSFLFSFLYFCASVVIFRAFLINYLAIVVKFPISVILIPG